MPTESPIHKMSMPKLEDETPTVADMTAFAVTADYYVPLNFSTVDDLDTAIDGEGIFGGEGPGSAYMLLSNFGPATQSFLSTIAGVAALPTVIPVTSNVNLTTSPVEVISHVAPIVTGFESFHNPYVTFFFQAAFDATNNVIFEFLDDDDNPYESYISTGDGAIINNTVPVYENTFTVAGTNRLAVFFGQPLTSIKVQISTSSGTGTLYAYGTYLYLV